MRASSKAINVTLSLEASLTVYYNSDCDNDDEDDDHANNINNTYHVTWIQICRYHNYLYAQLENVHTQFTATYAA